MRIGMIGGVERNENVYRDIARAAGHSLHLHGGHVGGRGTASLIDLVRGADLLVVVTDVNSHGAVQLARRLARKHGVPLVLQRRCSASRFAALLVELESPSAARAAG